MTDHPDAAHIDRLMKNQNDPAFLRVIGDEDERAFRAGAAALRALAEFRPHHPSTVVGSRYVVLVVPYQAWLDAQKAVGDHDLGPIDLEALRAAHDRDRQDHFEEMGGEAMREKWGAKL